MADIEMLIGELRGEMKGIHNTLAEHGEILKEIQTEQHDLTIKAHSPAHSAIDARVSAVETDVNDLKMLRWKLTGAALAVSAIVGWFASQWQTISAFLADKQQ
ncbi:MAG: hypothetical protein ACYC6A_00855 [Armatimonadota bacterium]